MNPDEHFIRRAVSEWMDATRRGDTTRVLEMMGEAARNDYMRNGVSRRP